MKWFTDMDDDWKFAIILITLLAIGGFGAGILSHIKEMKELEVQAIKAQYERR